MTEKRQGPTTGDLERCLSYGGVRQQRVDGIITPTHPFRYLLPSLSSKIDTYDNKQAFIY